MSYEGYYQLLCKNGHYFEFDVYDYDFDSKTWRCPYCHKEMVWQNQVDVTNGSFEYYVGDKYIDIENYQDNSGMTADGLDRYAEDMKNATRVRIDGRIDLEEIPNTEPKQYKIPGG